MSFSQLQIGFNRPEYLWLLALLPLLWWFSFRSLSGFGAWRRLLVLGLRSAVMAMIVLALAEIQWQRISDRVTVIYLLDQSESIPAVQRNAMLRYVTASVDKHRNAPRNDSAGIIIFGREAVVEIPPSESPIPQLGKLESSIDIRTDATNLAAALKMAQAMFTEDTSKRVVIVTDGNENMGDAKTIARQLADAGIGIDVVPIELTKGSEVAVERVAIPTDARQGQPTEMRVVLNNYAKATPDNPTGEARGKLRVTRSHDGEETLHSEEEVVLSPGKNVFQIQTTLDKTGAYGYRAEFLPEDKASDFVRQNNVATGFTYIRGKGRVLLIEHPGRIGEYKFLVDRLREMKLEVNTVPADNAFSSLAELQGYDTVVLANVPRGTAVDRGPDPKGGDDKVDLVGFSDEQIAMLVRNVEFMGAGLVMLGGDQAFGCGGWTGTELEKIMPVDFEIKNAAVKPNSALALLMHASELAQGNHWQKVVGKRAIEMLSPTDYCGVLHWDDFVGRDNWLWTGGMVQIGAQRNTLLARLGRMTPGDMPQFDPAMNKAFTAFQGLQGKASLKHMIIISDGDPSPPVPATVTQFVNARITISTVAIGTHGPAGNNVLRSIANQTGGKYYVVNNPNTLPTIYTTEVSRISKPLIYENTNGFTPKVMQSHEIMQGIDRKLPPLTGFVLTTRKEHPLVEVAIQSPEPDGGGENGTILAAWTYKAGRTVVFTSDSGARWAKDWSKWGEYDKIFSQMVRWSMRPVNEQGKFAIATDLKDGKVRVIVTALNQEDEFLNFLNMAASATTPDPTKPTLEIDMRQEAPGRYVGEFTADEAGSYFLAVSPGKGFGGPLLTGINVPYSSEFRERETNEALLTTLASLKPRGGEAGQLIDTDIVTAKEEELTKIDEFRATLAKAMSSRDMWPLLCLIAAGVFFADVFFRRVTIDPALFAPAIAMARRLVTRKTEEPVDQRLERLRTRKAQLAEGIDERRSAARFEPEVSPDAASKSLEDVMRDVASPTEPAGPRPTSTSTPIEQAEESYTDRLLKAKKRAQQNPPPES